MKKILQTSLLAVLMLVSASLYANEETFELKVKGGAQKSVAFFISEPLDVEFSISDYNAVILYQQNIHALQPIKKTYNLAAFPDGTYQLRLETELKITQYKIRIEEGKTIVEEPIIIQKLKPILTMQNAIVTLDMENMDKVPVEIKVVNEYNEQLYNSVFNSAKLSKKFNIAQANAKELTFIVRYKDQEFTKTLSVN